MRMRLLSLVAALPLFVSAFASDENLGYYMQPSLRGDKIVFVSQGDLWAVDTAGGIAHSLTSHVAPAANPAISPDGKWVAFTGSYEGPDDAYVMPIEGGQPTRLTFAGDTVVVGWCKKGVMVGSGVQPPPPTGEITIIDPASKSEVKVPLAQVNTADYNADGSTIFFTRYPFQGSHTKRYKGGTAQSVWRFTEGQAEAVPLTADFAGTSKSPMVWNGRVYFITDRDGAMNIWSMDENGHGLKQVTHSVGWDIQSFSLDNGRIAYQLGADIHLLNLGDGTDRVVQIGLASDFDQTRDHWIKTPMQYLSAANPSSDGAKVALTARGQVFVAPAEPGRFIEVSRKPGVRYREAMFMPDGKSVIALSDESGETEWWKMPANGIGPSEQITSGAHALVMRGAISPDGKFLAYADHDQNLFVCDLSDKKSSKIASSMDGELTDLRWSPDSKWLAYVMPTATFNHIELYSLSSGKATTVTSNRSDSSSPAWSPDGKWLYFLADRTFRSTVPSPWGSRQPEPYFDKETKIYALGLTKRLRSPFQAPDELYTPPEDKPAKGPVAVNVDLDGIETREYAVPVPAGNYSSLYASPERLLFASGAPGQRPALNYIDIKNRDASMKTLVDGINSFSLTQDNKKVLIHKDGNLYVVNAAPGATLDKPVDLSGWTMEVVPREEWRQMFTEAWRLERDYFYDTKMNSVDWNAMLKKYQPLVDRVRDRDELSNVLGQMIGELSALHMFVYGGDSRESQENIPGGYLGADFVKVTDGFKVSRVYQGDPDYPDDVSPLAQPGVDVSEGDTILSVDGVNADTAPDLTALLRNKAGKQVLLSVKDGKTGEIRQCIVRPITLRQNLMTNYSDWELSRRNVVEKEGTGQIGYVHLRAMGSGDIAQWERDFYPVFNRAGLIIDVRHNGGGNIDSWIIEKLMRKAWFYWQPRIGEPYWNMQEAFRGHVVVLCDAFTASDGEAFTEGIKRLKLGTVIGTRTWGGEIWLSSSNFLNDGGIATAAEFGVYGPEGQWLIEGHGVDPDIVVDNLPHATYEGKDAQLEAAIKYLQKEIKDHPLVTPPPPKYPNKSFPEKPLQVVGSGK